MKILNLLILPILALFLTQSIAADLSIESALAGCAAIKDSKQKAKCYEAVTKLSSQANPGPPSTVQAQLVKTSRYSNFITQAKHDITHNLKDPSSVQWRNLFVSGDEMLVLCGEMNAKNSYGAFVGFKRFYAAENAGLQDTENAEFPDFMKKMWPIMCGKKLEDVGAAESGTIMSAPAIDAAQKEKWIIFMAQKNGCQGAVRVKARNKNGTREKFEAVCENKALEFTCEFVGEISESMGGIPVVAVSGKSYKTQPACWM